MRLPQPGIVLEAKTATDQQVDFFYLENVLNRSLFTILGSGRTPDLYPVYLAILERLYEYMIRHTDGSYIPYDEARDEADRVIQARDIKDIQTDEEFGDPVIEKDVSVSLGGRLLFRLINAGWLTRQRGEAGFTVIGFPSHVFATLETWHFLREAPNMEQEKFRIVSVLETLQSRRGSRREAVRYAGNQIRQVISNLYRLLNDLQQNDDLLDQKSPVSNLSSWVESFSDREGPGQLYNDIRQRNSPDRWTPEINTAVSVLQDMLPKIVAESLPIAATTVDIQRTTEDLAERLMEISNGMNAIRGIVDQMDVTVSRFTRAYSQQVSAILNEPAAAKSLDLIKLLLQQSKVLPPHKAIQPNWRFRALRSDSIQFQGRQRRRRGREVVPSIDTTPPPEIVAKEKGRYGGFFSPTEVEEYFNSRLGDRDSILVEELLAQAETWEESLMISRLLDYCGMVTGFGYEVLFPKATESTFIPPLDVENKFKRISNVMIHRRKLSLSASAEELPPNYLSE